MRGHALYPTYLWIRPCLIFFLVLIAFNISVTGKLMCRNRLRKRDLADAGNKEKKPCCLPETWKARFVVHSIAGGNHKSRVDHGAFRMYRWPDGTVHSAVLVVGKLVASPEFCHLTPSNLSQLTESLCPEDRVACLRAPYLGEPRCLTEKNGYTLKRSRPDPKTGKVVQTWFIDQVNQIHGSIERHTYQVERRYGLCRLLNYRVQWGHYALPWRNCRLFLRMERTFRPVSGSFKLHFKHNLTDNLLFC
ncbi:unnamed protein product [Dicrocoelium dendriticum]|nr:unnamed protein product [Dicrocoelium dendriticum]